MLNTGLPEQESADGESIDVILTKRVIAVITVFGNDLQPGINIMVDANGPQVALQFSDAVHRVAILF